MKQRDWSETEVKQLLEAVAAGKSMAAIASDLGRKFDSVRHAIKKYVVERKEPNFRLWWTDARMAELTRRAAAGETYKAISAAMGCTEGGARNKIRLMRVEGVLSPFVPLGRPSVKPRVSREGENPNQDPAIINLSKDRAGGEKLLDAVLALGGHKDAVRAPLTFEQQLALVASGKARVKVKPVLPVYAGECFAQRVAGGF